MIEILNKIKSILIDLGADCETLTILTHDNAVIADIRSIEKPLSINALHKVDFFIENYIYIDSISGLHESINNQRIVFKCFFSQDEFNNYVLHIEGLKKLDHRYIGTHLKYFIFDPIHAPGMIIWLNKGLQLYETIKDYMRIVMRKHGYTEEVVTPCIADLSLYSKSGHVDMYSENIFFIKDEDSLLKPMNCPFHILIFKNKHVSYKDLPVKIFEFGCCSRNENKSALHGLFRARCFTQDDSHVFCTENDIEDVVLNFCQILLEVYNKFGFDHVQLKLSTRPDKYVGDIDIWDKAEAALENVAKQSGIAYEINPGDGAFYGPKLDFHIRDNRGRIWQCGTVQLDFMLAKKLDATYVDHDKGLKTPVMIHHAVLGSIERFMGIIIEHYKGHLPLWLAPIKISILPINNNEDVMNYSNNLSNILTNEKISHIIDKSNDTLGAKIRKSWIDEFIPISIIIGSKEIVSNKLAIRINGEQVNDMEINEIIKYIRNEGN